MRVERAFYYSVDVADGTLISGKSSLSAPNDFERALKMPTGGPQFGDSGGVSLAERPSGGGAYRPVKRPSG